MRRAKEYPASDILRDPSYSNLGLVGSAGGFLGEFTTSGRFNECAGYYQTTRESHNCFCSL